MAANTLSDESLIEFCNSDSGTMSYCQENEILAERLDNSTVARSTGRSPSTAASVRSALSTTNNVEASEFLASLDDRGFVEAVSSNDRAADLVVEDHYLSIRLNSLDAPLARSIGIPPPARVDLSTLVGSGSARSTTRGTPSRSARPITTSPTRGSPVRSRTLPPVRRTADGTIILTDSMTKNAQILSQVPQAELDEYVEDRNVANILASPQYKSIVAERSASPIRSRSPSPVRTIPSARSSRQPSTLRSRVVNDEEEEYPLDVPEYGAVRSRSPSPARRPFSASSRVTTSPRRSPVQASPRSTRSPARSVFNAPLTYNVAEDAKTLSTYPRSEVAEAARADTYIASVTRSAEYRRQSAGNKGELLTGTCTVSCRRG